MAYQINYDDPRYKKAVLEAGAYQYGAGGKNQRGLVSDISSRFTAQQMGELTSFQRIQSAKNRQSDRLDLAKDKLKFQKRMFKNKMDDERDAMNFTTIFGLGTGIYSALEGQRRRKASEALTQKNTVFREEQLAEQQRQNSTIEELLRRYK